MQMSLEVQIPFAEMTDHVTRCEGFKKGFVT